jgi:chloramphenicol 3-O-phosphotransferase
LGAFGISEQKDSRANDGAEVPSWDCLGTTVGEARVDGRRWATGRAFVDGELERRRAQRTDEARGAHLGVSRRMARRSNRAVRGWQRIEACRAHKMTEHEVTVDTLDTRLGYLDCFFV